MPDTEVSGCPLERRRNSREGVDLTYARHVAPILQKRCQECHRPGEIGPFSLLSFEDAEKRTSRIREVVLEERMPPWHADPRHGKFANDRRLTQEEHDTLLAWIDQGAKKGDDKDMPPAVTFTQGWKIGEPDKVFSMTEEFKVPATGVMDYQRFVVDPGFKTDVWVREAECRPGNRKVVHHIIVYILAPGRREPYEADGTASTLVGWAPGDMPATYAPTRPGSLPPARSWFLRSTIPPMEPSRPTARRSESGSHRASLLNPSRPTFWRTCCSSSRPRPRTTKGR